MRENYDEVRRHILSSGRPLVAAKGFVGVGLSEILGAAGVPRGSFYHYFNSKEGYGRALLEHYIEDYLQALNMVLQPDGAPAAWRLMRYWRRWCVTQCNGNDHEKCLVVKLGAEIADLSADMREVLHRGTDRIIARIAECIAEGLVDGSMRTPLTAAVAAEQLYQLWLGASLLAKLRQGHGPFDAALISTQALLAIAPDAVAGP